MALQAGFMEECLFRAIPLSLAALIGARFGCAALAASRAALSSQALVFGAAHANYPGFPPYSRLVELFVPALIWGLIFLRFGLLPTIILHAVFDLTLMSLPVFLVQGPARDLQSRAGRRRRDSFRSAIVLVAPRPGRTLARAAAHAAQWRLATPVTERSACRRMAAHAPAGVWTDPGAARAAAARRSPASRPFAFTADLSRRRAAAEDRPRPGRGDRRRGAEGARRGARTRVEALRRHSRWRTDDASRWAWHRFVWREAGPEAYRKLIGSWLAPPMWEVRYARFGGVDVADRAEEWHVTIQGDGTVRQVGHQLPEQRAGRASDARRRRARSPRREIATRFGLDPAALREVEVKQDPRPARTDWQFTYADPRRRRRQGRRSARGWSISPATRSSAGAATSSFRRRGIAPSASARSRLSVVRIAVALASCARWPLRR